MPEFLVFENDSEVLYFNNCEYSFDFERKSFEAKADGVEIDITQINQKFCCHDNIYIAFSSENESNGFALVFKDDAGSKEINASFKKMRQTNGMNINYFRPTFRKFLTLLFGAIKKDVLNVADLRRIANALKFSDEEKEKYKDILPFHVIPSVKPEPDVIVLNQPEMKQELEDVDLVVEVRASVINQELIANITKPSTTPKPSAVYIELMNSDDEDEGNENLPHPSRTDTPADSTLPVLIATKTMDSETSTRNLRKRSIKKKIRRKYSESSDFDSDDEEYNDTPKSKKQRKQTPKNSPYQVSKFHGEIIKAPGFKLTQKKFHGKMVEKIIVYCCEDRSLVYEYSKHNKKGKYYCGRCYYKHKVFVYLHLCNDSVNGNYIKLNDEKHQCQPIKYIPSEYSEIDDTATTSENLIKNTPNLKNVSETLDFNETFVVNKENHETPEQNKSATISKRGRKPNGCKASPIRLTNYKLEHFTKSDRTKLQLLTIYESDANKELCRTYFFHKDAQSFYCNACFKTFNKFISVKLNKNEEMNEMFAEFGANPHLCQPEPEGLSIYKPNFEYQKNGDGTIKKLRIFATEDKKLCYHFKHIKDNRYMCDNCTSAKKARAKLYQNQNNKYYVKMGLEKHNCHPIIYYPVTSNTNV